MAMDLKRKLEMTLRKQLLETVVSEFKAEIELSRKNPKKNLNSVEDDFLSENLLKKMGQEYPLYAVGTSLYTDKLQSKYTQPFHRRTQFSKPIEENYDSAFKQE